MLLLGMFFSSYINESDKICEFADFENLKLKKMQMKSKTQNKKTCFCKIHKETMKTGFNLLHVSIFGNEIDRQLA